MERNGIDSIKIHEKSIREFFRNLQFLIFFSTLRLENFLDCKWNQNKKIWVHFYHFLVEAQILCHSDQYFQLIIIYREGH